MIEHNFWKGYFINYLIKKYNIKKYLELGIGQFDTWNIVNCEYKIGVDYNPSIKMKDIFNYTTDEYFENLDENEKFDLVYIDACHEKNHVKKDFLNSIKHLNNNGIVLFHDINSWTKEGSIPYGSHGDCYEFWISLVDKYDTQCMTFRDDVHLDYIGIFFNNGFKIDDVFDMNYGYDFFCNEREKYLYSRHYSDKYFSLEIKK